MIESENFFYDFNGVVQGSLIIPIINSKDHSRIIQARPLDSFGAAPVYHLELRQGFDIITTGPVFRNIYSLTWPIFSSFPDTLQEFSDVGIEGLLKMLFLSKEELLELRELEIRLAEAIPNYRSQE